MIERSRAVLQAFAGLELVEAEVEPDAVTLGFGPGGERWMHLYEQHLVVAGGDGSPPERFERGYGGLFPETGRAAAGARVRTLVGRRLSSIEHGRRHRLTLRFAGGGALRTLPPAQWPMDWYVDDERRAVRVDAEVPADRTRWAGREVNLVDDDRLLRVEHGGTVAGGGDLARSIVEGLVGLPLTGTHRRDLLFGEVLRVDGDGEKYAERTVLAGQAATTIEPPPGAGEPWVRDADTDYTTAELHAALEPLMGRHVVAAERDEADGLEIRFAGGGRIALGPTTGNDLWWTAFDGGARDGIAALSDGSLVGHDSYMNGGMAPETGVWGTLGVLRPEPYRAPRPLEPARPAPRSLVSGVLGALTGRRLASVVPARPEGLVLRFAPEASVKLESCHVTVDDGASRVRHHRRDDGRLADVEAASARLAALVGRTVEAVALDATTLTLALSGGGRVALTPNAFDLAAWRLSDSVGGHRVTCVPGIARGGPEDDPPRLHLGGSGTPRRAAEIVGALGAIASGEAPDGRDPLAAARALLAALLGAPLTAARGRRLYFGERLRLWTSDGDLRLDGRRLASRAWEDELAPALGAAVVALRHEETGRLRLDLSDGHEIAIDPSSEVIPSWSAGVRRDRPWIAATYDGVIRVLPADAPRADAPRALLSGSLGTLPAYGFKS